MALRAGSWKIGGISLPELGITEAISKVVNKPLNSQGGSNLFGTSSAAYTPPPPISTPPPSLDNNKDNVNNNRTNTNGGVLGASTGFQSSIQGLNDQQSGGLDLIEQEYNNAIGALSAQEGVLRGQAGTAEQQIESEAGQLRTQLGKEQGTAEQGIASQQQTAEKSGASALQQARDLFRQTQQQNIAQLSGAGLSSSSVAEALAERLGVETSRRIAGVTGSLAEVRQNAAKELARTKDYYQSKLTDVQNQVQVQKANIQNSLVQGLNQINSAKNQAASDKARGRYELITSVQNAINSLTQQQQQFENSLKQWATQKQAALTPIITDPNFINTISSAQTEFAKDPNLSKFNIAPSFSTDAYGAVNSPIKWSTSTKKNEEDLSNPFAT